MQKVVGSSPIIRLILREKYLQIRVFGPWWLARIDALSPRFNLLHASRLTMSSSTLAGLR